MRFGGNIFIHGGMTAVGSFLKTDTDALQFSNLFLNDYVWVRDVFSPLFVVWVCVVVL